MRSWELQQAIYAKLSANADLQALGVTVYDHVPQRSDYPRTVIGEDFPTQADTDDTLDSNHEITLHHWSRDVGQDGYPGKVRHSGSRQVKQMEQACYKALHRQPLVVAGAAFTDCQALDSDIFLDPDGLTRHLVQRFIVLLDNMTP